MYRLHSYILSGNCYKVRLLLARLAIPYELVEVDLLAPGGRPEGLVAAHPLGGQVPLLELPDRTCLGESGAILYYLATGSPFLPDELPFRAQVLQWMFFEQNQHEPAIATSRYWLSVRREPDARREQLGLWHEGGCRALDVMERHLGVHEFLAAYRYTIADIALYAYTHVADQGGFDLAPYPAVRRWLERVRGQAGHVPMA